MFGNHIQPQGNVRRYAGLYGVGFGWLLLLLYSCGMGLYFALMAASGGQSILLIIGVVALPTVVICILIAFAPVGAIGFITGQILGSVFWHARANLTPKRTVLFSLGLSAISSIALLLVGWQLLLATIWRLTPVGFWQWVWMEIDEISFPFIRLPIGIYAVATVLYGTWLARRLPPAA